ncbi:hypothetical protein D3C80_1957040 [compost metagenome]
MVNEHPAIFCVQQKIDPTIEHLTRAQQLLHRVFSHGFGHWPLGFDPGVQGQLLCDDLTGIYVLVHCVALQ